MRAAQLVAPRRFELRQIAEPSLANDGDVLVRIATVGVCGSDVHYFQGGRIGSQIVEYPFTIGHEAAGVVVAVGKAVTRVRAGQRIAIDPARSCGHCDQCRAGRENTCHSLQFLGCPGQLGGCLCELVVLDEHCCYPIEDSMTFEQATLSEPLAIALYAVERSRPEASANVAVFGAGPIGMSVLHALRARVHGQVFVTEKVEARSRQAQALGPTWCGLVGRHDVAAEIRRREPAMLDVVYECSGDADAIAQAIGVLKPGGSLVLIGIPEADAIPFPIHELRRNELTIVNVRRQAHSTALALEELLRGHINLDELVTHRYSLEDVQAAFEVVASYRDGVMKAMISIV